jgi:chromosome transmission fidelity protein 1
VEQQEKFARIRRVDRARGESKRAAKRLKVDSGAAGAAAESGVGGEDDGDDGEFMVTDYISEDEDTASSSDDEDEEETDHVTKILFCSRTHSQLTQFMREIRSSPFGEDARAVVLGSRQTLCINEKVTRLSSQAQVRALCRWDPVHTRSVATFRINPTALLHQMNDKCKDLQQKKAAAADDERKSAGCPFLDAKKVKSFGERALARVQDVEELLGLGNRTGACPYYGTRSAIAEAEIVAMPYNLLLHKYGVSSTTLVSAACHCPVYTGIYVLPLLSKSHRSVVVGPREKPSGSRSRGTLS